MDKNDTIEETATEKSSMEETYETMEAVLTHQITSGWGLFRRLKFGEPRVEFVPIAVRFWFERDEAGEVQGTIQDASGASKKMLLL